MNYLIVISAVFFMVNLYSKSIIVRAWNDYDIQVIQRMNDSVDLMDFQVKYKRINRTSYGLTGSVQLGGLEGFDSELLIYHSPKSNDQYVLTPYKLPRGPICVSLNNDYRKFLMENLKGYSDFPQSEDTSEDLCPQFSDHKFEIKDLILTDQTVPKDLAEGTWKVEGYMYKGMILENGILFIIKIF